MTDQPTPTQSTEEACPTNNGEESTAVGKHPSPAAAVRRCRAAYRRAYDAKIAEYEDPKYFYRDAEQAGSAAFRNAMPMLTGVDSIREFAACIAQGILMEAIPQDQANHLLHAAKVAFATLIRAPQPARKTRSEKNSAQNPTFEDPDLPLSTE